MWANAREWKARERSGGPPGGEVVRCGLRCVACSLRRFWPGRKSYTQNKHDIVPLLTIMQHSIPPSIGMRLRPPRKLKERGCRRYPFKKVHTDRIYIESWTAVGGFKCNLLKVCDDLSGSRIVYVSKLLSLRGCPCGAYVFWFWFLVLVSGSVFCSWAL